MEYHISNWHFEKEVDDFLIENKLFHGAIIKEAKLFGLLKKAHQKGFSFMVCKSRVGFTKRYNFGQR